MRFALNVWAGWGPIILANNGFKAGKVWKTPDGKEFQVELVLIDDPVAMIATPTPPARSTSAGARWTWCRCSSTAWSTRRQAKDSRVMPRIYQQVDWSNGGDGIVVRENIKTVADLRGKKLVLAQNSPSQYFALNMLVAGGVQPSEVEHGLHRTRLRGGRAPSTSRKTSPAPSPGRPTSTTWPRSRATACW